MATSHGIVTQNATTSVAPVTQDYTKASLGTVKGYIGLMSSVTAANTDIDNLVLSFGASDLGASDNHLQAFNYEDNVSTSDSKSINRNTQVMRGDEAGQDSGDEIAEHDSTITDGVRVNWTATSAAKETSAILFKEGIANFDCQTITANGTGSTTITPGFQADGVIIFTSGVTIVNTGPNGANMSVGFYDTSNYSTFLIDGDHNLTTPTSAQYHTTTQIGGQATSAGGLTNHFTIGNITATSFDITKVSGSNAQVLLVISIKMDAGYLLDVGTVDAEQSTGVASTITGLSFQPQISLFAGSTNLSTGGESDEGSLFFGACDADAEVCVGGYIEDFTSISNTDCGSWHRNDSALYLKNSAGTLVGQASFDSFQSDGVDLNWTTASGGAFQVGYMAIGQVGGGGSTSPIGGGARGISRGSFRGVY